MAAYFQLVGLESHEATSFNLIDDEICAHFGWPVDPVTYAYGWYDAIGARVATGSSLQQVRETFLGYITEAETDERKAKQKPYYETLIKILDFIETKYTTNSWYSRG